MYLKAFLVVAVLFMMLTQSAQAQATKAAIEAWHKKYLAAIHSGDMGAIATLYTDDAQVYSEEGLLDGKKAIVESAKKYSEWLRSNKITLELSNFEEEKHGRIAYNTGKYVHKGADGKTVSEGFFIGLWKQDNGEWKIFRDIANSTAKAKKE